jgi:hypothetical protein
MQVTPELNHTEISMPETCFSHSDASSDVSLIKDYPSSIKRIKFIRQRRFWYPNNSRTSQIMWKVYLPSLLVVLMLVGVIGAYAYHAATKVVPSPLVRDSNYPNSTDSSTIKDNWTRKFDSRDGTSRKGQPLNSLEVARYQLCEERFDGLTASEFATTQCPVCAQDLGIVSQRVLNLCVASAMMAPSTKDVCQWDGIRCNLQGQILAIVIETSNSGIAIPADVSYFERLEVLEVHSTSIPNNMNTLRAFPSSVFDIPSLRELTLTRLSIHLELPDEQPASRLHRLQFDHILLNQLPVWLSEMPMEHFSLSNLALGTTPKWFQGSLWTHTIKTFRIQNCTMLPLPIMHFLPNVTVEIN